MSRLPCSRLKVTNRISLYREQVKPNPIWTKRWKNFTLQNIKYWASTTIRKIKVSQGMGNSSYELEVRQFLPMDGDLMEKFWTVEGVKRAYPVSPYAIVDLEKAAQSRLRFLQDNVRTYINCSINNSDQLIRVTYERAMRHAEQAPVRSPECLVK